MTTAIFSEDTNTYNLCPNSKHEMVTKKRTSFTDDIVISGVTITVDNYDHVNENNEEHQYNGTLDGTMVSGSLELEQHQLENLDPKLLQAAQLFVQDLIERAKIEVTKKLASSERQICQMKGKNKQINSEDREFQINGDIFKEKRKVTTYSNDLKSEYSNATTIIEHIRSIKGKQDRRLLITGYFLKGRIKGAITVETNMTEKEVNEFEEDWEEAGMLVY